MTLRITKSSEPIRVDRLIATIYAPPGVGKTSLASTAEKPLLLDFDSGAYRSKNRCDAVQVKSWADVSGISADDLKPYKTLILDTAGRALDTLAVDIIKGNPKLARNGGSLTLQGFGVLKDRFKAFTTLIRSFGLDIVLLLHVDEQKNGDDVIERLDAQGASRGEIYKLSDLMGRLKIENGKRILNFNPTDTAFGKNPAGFKPLEVPDFGKNPHYLADVLQQTKDALNALTEEQTKTANELKAWGDKYQKANTADEFNKLITETAKDASEAVRANAGRLLVQTGKAKGLVYDSKAKGFRASDVTPEAANSSAEEKAAA